MFSYRHAFHAGNHADVLKHFVLVQLLQYMNQKDTAYSYIDTHAGAGVYALDGNFASKNAEYETGIGPLWERTDMPAALAEYVDLIKSMNPSGKMRYYPGSPYCAEQVARGEIGARRPPRGLFSACCSDAARGAVAALPDSSTKPAPASSPSTSTR